MGILQWGLETVVVALLAVTLLRTWRLDRALSLVRSDRSGLEALLAALEMNMRQARAGIDRLQGLADGAGRRIEQQSQAAITLRDELAVLLDRGERLAERLDQSVRAARAAVLVLEAEGSAMPGGHSSNGLAAGGHTSTRNAGKAIALTAPLPGPLPAPLSGMASSPITGGASAAGGLAGPIVSGGPIPAATMAGASFAGGAMSSSATGGGTVPGTALAVGVKPRGMPVGGLSGGMAPPTRPARLTAPSPAAGSIAAQGPTSGYTDVPTLVERDGDRVRSQAERDLLAVLRAGR